MPSPSDVTPAPPPESGTLASAGAAQSTPALVREQFEQFKAEFLAAVKAERRRELHDERRRFLEQIILNTQRRVMNDVRVCARTCESARLAEIEQLQERLERRPQVFAAK